MTYESNTTDRGFRIDTFTDYNGQACSLQMSSLADAQCVWLGVKSERMHLTQDQVKALLPALQHFAEHGEMPTK